MRAVDAPDAYRGGACVGVDVHGVLRSRLKLYGVPGRRAQPVLNAPVIGRRGRRGLLLWSLPKGHIEPGETPEHAAVWEVEVETGLLGRVVATLGSIDFWFPVEVHHVHKTVQHYLLEAVGGELCCDDYEVAVAAWVPLNELESRLAYPDERGVVARATGVLHAGLHGGRRL